MAKLILVKILSFITYSCTCIFFAHGFQLDKCKRGASPRVGDDEPCSCPASINNGRKNIVVQGPITNSSWIWNDDYGTWQPRVNDKNDAPIKIAGDGVAGSTISWKFVEGSAGNVYVVQELIYWGVPANGAIDNEETAQMKNLAGGSNGTKIMDRFGAHVENVVYACQMVWSGAGGMWWMVLTATGSSRTAPINPSCTAGADCPISSSCYLREADCRWSSQAEDWDCGSLDPCAWDPSGTLDDDESLQTSQANNNLYKSCDYSMVASSMALPATALNTGDGNETIVIGNPATARNGAELKPADPGKGGGIYDTLILCNKKLDFGQKIPLCDDSGSSSRKYSEWPYCPNIVKSYWTRTMCQGYFNCLNGRLIENYAKRQLNMTFLSVIFSGGAIFAAGWLFFFYSVRDPVDTGEEADDDASDNPDKKILPPSVLIAREKRKNDLDSALPMRCGKCANPINDTKLNKIKFCSNCGTKRSDFIIFSKYSNDWVPIEEVETQKEKQKQ
jgi:hypothetical protein